MQKNIRTAQKVINTRLELIGVEAARVEETLV